LISINYSVADADLMNKQLKIVAISGMLAVIAGIAVATSLEQAQAQMGGGNPLTEKKIGAKSPGQYGAATAGIVCGDRLCSQPESLIDIEEDTPIGSIGEDDADAPTVKLIGIDKYRESTNRQGEINYRITFSVTAGSQDLRNIEFRIHSDLTTVNFEIASLNSLKSSVNVVRVKAIDPDSITGELIAYSITGPTSSVPGAPR